VLKPEGRVYLTVPVVRTEGTDGGFDMYCVHGAAPGSEVEEAEGTADACTDSDNGLREISVLVQEAGFSIIAQRFAESAAVTAGAGAGGTWRLWLRKL
jgi:hypothetical protein